MTKILKSTSSPDSRDKAISLVAIGASAGGLEALQAFLSFFPKIDNCAIIIAQHLSPKHKSMLVQLLSKGTELQVAQAEDGQQVAANKVYITPPNKEITLEGGIIHLNEPSTSFGPKPSVDVLFRSLAMETYHRKIAVILSGTGTDGSKGIKEMCDSETLILVQSPETAKYNGMPEAAIQTGLVDQILPPEEMGKAIQHYIERDLTPEAPSEEVFEDGVSLKQVFSLLSKRTGTDFSNYKPATIGRRLEKRMNSLHLTQLEDYLKVLEKNPKELDEMFKTILIGVTGFFRDTKAFDRLREQLKKIIKNKKSDTSIRVWVPGCSTGEEAYSIAMVIHSLLGDRSPHFTIQVFASDIDDRAIATGRKAVYSSQSMEHVPEDIKTRYFIKRGNSYEVIKIIRSLVLFSKHDVSSHPPFLRIDLISCRNLLIYFNTALQQQVIPIFHYALNFEGLLFLGKSETIGQFSDLFEAVDSKNKLFQRKSSPGTYARTFAKLRTHLPVAKTPPLPVNKPVTISDLVRDTLYKTYEHPYVVVDTQFELHEVSGDVRLFLSLPEGSIQNNLIKMLNSELQIEVRSVLTRAIKDRISVRSIIKRFPLFGTEYFVRVIAKPLLKSEDISELYLVIFEKLDIEQYLERHTEQDNKELSSARMLELEQELAATKEHLQTYIEEIETSNEELQSLNEELQSANEELQSGNEELETSHEELQSTNEELQIAYTELKSLYDLLQTKDEILQRTEEKTRALLNNIVQAIIMLDRDGMIMEFNDQASDLFAGLNTEKSMEVGVRFFDFLPEDLLDSSYHYITKAWKGEYAIEEHISFTKEGQKRIYTVHYTPIASSTGGVTAVAVSYYDQTEKVKLRLKSVELEGRFKRLIETSPLAIYIADLEGQIKLTNRAAAEMTGYAIDEILCMTVMDIDAINLSLEECQNIWKTIQPDAPLQFETKHRVKSGQIIDVELHMTSVSLDGQLLIFVNAQDISQRKQQEAALRESEFFLKESQRIAKLGNWNLDLPTNKLTWSEMLYEVLGADKSTFHETHHSFIDLVDAEDQERVRTTSLKTQQTGESFNITYRITTPTGEKRIIEEYGFSEKNDQGEIVRLFGTAQDVTHRTQLEEKVKASNLFFQHAKDMLCIAGMDGYFKVLNPSWSAILGWSEEELLSRPWNDFVHPDDVNLTNTATSTLKDGSIVIQFENRYRCNDGTYKWLSWSSYPDKEQQVLYGIARDITDKKQAETALKESETRFKQIAETSQVVIWELDALGTYTYFSPLCEDVFGFTAEELVYKKTFMDLHPEEGKEAFIKTATEYIKSKRIIRDLINPIQRADGTIRWMQTNGTPFFDSDGLLLGYRGSDQDITERLEFQRKLEASHELLSKLTEQIPGVVYQYKLNPDGSSSFPYASKGMIDIYGYKPEEVKADATPVFGRLHPEDHARVSEAISKSAEELSFFRCEYRVIMANGDEQWRLSNARPERLPDGSTLWHGVITDITEQKQGQIALSESEQRYRLVINNSSDIIALLDKHGVQRFISPAAKSITGYEPEELVGKTINDVLHPDDIEKTAAVYAKALAHPNKSYRAQYRHIHKTKEWVWLEGSAQNFLGDPAFNAVLLTVRDISKQKETEDQLRKLSQVAEQSPASVVITDLDGDISYVNKTFTKITGYKEKEVLGKNPSILKSGYQSDGFYKEMWDAISSGNVWRGELLNKRKNGELYWESASISPILNESGIITHYLGVKVDITQEKTIRDALNVSEEKYRIVADNTYNWEFWEDINGKLLYVSPSCERVTGYTAEEFYTTPDLLYHIIHPEDADHFKHHKHEVTDQVRSGECHFRIIMKNGATRYIHHVCQPALDANGINCGVRGTNLDVTEEELNRQALMASQDRYRSIVTVSNTGAWEYNRDTKRLWCSPEYYAMLGYSAEEFDPTEGDLVKNWNDLLHPSDLESAIQVFAEYLKSDFSVDYENYFRLMHKEGHVIWVRSRGTCLKDAQGNFTPFILGTHIEITDIKKAEMHLKEQTLHLQNTNEELEQFAYVASHDLQEPLRMVSSFLALLERKYNDKLDDKAHQYIKFAVDGALRMRRIILDLLEYSRVGRFVNPEKDVDLIAVVEEIISMHQAVIQQTGASITYDALPTLFVDQTPLYQIFKNLIGNALKYCKKDVAPQVHIGWREDSRMYTFFVQDNGMGISPEYHEKIFVIFQRLHTQDEHDGTGMGLAVAKKIVTHWGGKIWLESEEGKGSTFYFTIPKK